MDCRNRSRAISGSDRFEEVVLDVRLLLEDKDSAEGHSAPSSSFCCTPGDASWACSCAWCSGEALCPQAFRSD